MARLLVEDVTLIKGDQITVQVRFKGGAARTLSLLPPKPAWATWKSHPEVVAEVDRLLNDYTEASIAARLNARGWPQGKDGPSRGQWSTRIRYQYRLRSRFDRRREVGMLTQEEIADQLGVSRKTVHDWRRMGLLKAQAYNDKPEYLYEPVGTNGPHKQQGIKRTDPPRFPKASSEKMKEVQDEV